MEQTLPPTHPPHSQPQTSGLAITSMVLGILVFCTGGLTSLPAIITGHIAQSRIKRSQGEQGGKGMAIAGLVMGYLGILVFIAALVGMAVAIQGQRITSARMEIISNMRTMGLELAEFETEYGALPSDALAEKVQQATSSSLSMTGADVLNQLEAYSPGILEEVLTVGKSTGGDWIYFPGQSMGNGESAPVLISPGLGSKRVVLYTNTSVQVKELKSLETLLYDPNGVMIPARR